LHEPITVYDDQILDYLSREGGTKRRTTTMTQSETRVPEYLADIAIKNFETLAAIQKQLLDVLNKANREWVAFLNEEVELASNLSKKMTTAKSIPDATAAYQELISRQMELMTQQAKIIFQNTQEFTKTCMQVVSGGRAGAGG
jgi:hypothetical protein